MIVRTLQEAEKGDRRVVSDNWGSTRLLLKGDNAGYSFHITTIFQGTETLIWYKNHIESVYCMDGEGEVEVLDQGKSKIHPIGPGTIYILDKHDRHILRAKTELKLACVFNPPLCGKEVHDENGVYPLEAEAIVDDG
ncbi:MAG: ectoine synthase [Euryarchaeota archaeon]|nr:ectoine synthase [Euryarchaeota archaeon]